MEAKLYPYSLLLFHPHPNINLGLFRWTKNESKANMSLCITVGPEQLGDLTLSQKIPLLGNIFLAHSASSLTASFLAQFSTGANLFAVGE